MFKSWFSKRSRPSEKAAQSAARSQLELASLALLSPDRLSEFQVFARADRDDLVLLADKLEPSSILAGESLFSAGDDDDRDYLLLEGNLRLCGTGGETRELVAGTERTSRLVSGVHPHEYSALAVTDCVYLALEPAMLGALLPDEPESPGAWSNSAFEPDDGELSSQEVVRLMESFKRDLAENRFKLTSIPDVALKIRRVVDDPDVTADRVADVIATDPAIAAKISKAANSALYRGLESCDTLRDAVVRLGVGTTRHLVFSFTLRDLFNTRVPELLRIVRDSWDHSVFVGAVAAVLAKHSRQFSPEEGMLAGLLSNIGVLAVVDYLANYPEIYSDPTRCRAIIDELKGEIGGLVLEHWHFPDDIVACARFCEQWGYCGDQTEQADLCDLVVVASYHANIGRCALPRIDLVPACQRLLGAPLCPESAKTFLTSAREEIREARALIGG